MVQQIRTNRNVEQVLAEFAGRSGLEDVQNLAEVLGIGKRTEVIWEVSCAIRQK